MEYKACKEYIFIEMSKLMFGEIKAGDTFEFENRRFKVPVGFEIKYVHHLNQLLVDNYMVGYTLYKEGIWAKKVSDAIQVHGYLNGIYENSLRFDFDIFPLNSLPDLSKDIKISDYMAECLENYLNIDNLSNNETERN